MSILRFHRPSPFIVLLSCFLLLWSCLLMISLLVVGIFILVQKPYSPPPPPKMVPPPLPRYAKINAHTLFGFIFVPFVFILILSTSISLLHFGFSPFPSHFLFPLFIFFPKMISAVISLPRLGAGIFQYIDPCLADSPYGISVSFCLSFTDSNSYGRYFLYPPPRTSVLEGSPKQFTSCPWLSFKFK